jgi:DNA-binding MarR family transcriptional regulator
MAKTPSFVGPATSARVITPSDRALTELAARLRIAITRTARRLRQEAGTDLSPSQTAALSTIDRHGPLTPSELAALERVKRPTATRIVARLEGEGLVQRAADPADGRSFVVSATAQGRALMRKLRSRKNVYLARRLRELSGDEVAVLARAAEILERLQEGERR